MIDFINKSEKIINIIPESDDKDKLTSSKDFTKYILDNSGKEYGIHLYNQINTAFTNIKNRFDKNRNKELMNIQDIINLEQEASKVSNSIKILQEIKEIENDREEDNFSDEHDEYFNSKITDQIKEKLNKLYIDLTSQLINTSNNNNYLASHKTHIEFAKSLSPLDNLLTDQKSFYKLFENFQNTSSNSETQNLNQIYTDIEQMNYFEVHSQIMNLLESSKIDNKSKSYLENVKKKLYESLKNKLKKISTEIIKLEEPDVKQTEIINLESSLSKLATAKELFFDNSNQDILSKHWQEDLQKYEKSNKIYLRDWMQEIFTTIKNCIESLQFYEAEVQLANIKRFSQLLGDYNTDINDNDNNNNKNIDSSSNHDDKSNNNSDNREEQKVDSSSNKNGTKSKTTTGYKQQIYKKSLNTKKISFTSSGIDNKKDLSTSNNNYSNSDDQKDIVGKRSSKIINNDNSSNKEDKKDDSSSDDNLEDSISSDISEEDINNSSFSIEQKRIQLLKAITKKLNKEIKKYSKIKFKKLDRVYNPYSSAKPKILFEEIQRAKKFGYKYQSTWKKIRKNIEEKVRILLDQFANIIPESKARNIEGIYSAIYMSLPKEMQENINITYKNQKHIYNENKENWKSEINTVMQKGTLGQIKTMYLKSKKINDNRNMKLLKKDTCDKIDKLAQQIKIDLEDHNLTRALSSLDQIKKYRDELGDTMGPEFSNIYDKSSEIIDLKVNNLITKIDDYPSQLEKFVNQSNIISNFKTDMNTLFGLYDYWDTDKKLRNQINNN